VEVPTGFRFPTDNPELVTLQYEQHRRPHAGDPGDGEEIDRWLAEPALLKPFEGN
jgi:hypothetical protein